jgi:L-2,4-diaminobutyric acid acetyltransferase
MYNSQEVVLRQCTSSDVAQIVRFVAECPPLDVHSSFTYWVTFQYWGEMCFVASAGERIIGYVSALGSGHSSDVFYLWQIGVSEDRRSTGLAQRLVAAVTKAGRGRGFREMQVSIAPENESSLRTFTRFATSLGKTLDQCGDVSFVDPSGNPVHEDLYKLELA